MNASFSDEVVPFSDGVVMSSCQFLFFFRQFVVSSH
jgi:hypothetical protein